MKLISLSQNQFAIVDVFYWYDYLVQWKWSARWNKSTNSFYAVRVEGKKNIFMHRVVAKTPDGMYCDHIHHNTLDNRESELRNVTPSQSAMNRRKRRDNKLRIQGVCQPSGTKTYRAQLWFQGKRVLNKTFKTVEEAKKAYEQAVKKYHREFSNSDF